MQRAPNSEARFLSSRVSFLSSGTFYSRNRLFYPQDAFSILIGALPSNPKAESTLILIDASFSISKGANPNPTGAIFSGWPYERRVFMGSAHDVPFTDGFSIHLAQGLFLLGFAVILPDRIASSDQTRDSGDEYGT